ncbi:MAG: tetratricopeptide repeat protein, partial [Pyrinomonadaceae bacterium]
MDTESHRELEAGGEGNFRLLATRGQIFRVIIDKGDLAIRATVLDANGTKLFEQISRRYESLEIVLSAELDGAYQITIHSDENSGGRRTYAVRASKLTESVDIAKYEWAQKEMATASALQADWKETSLRRAAEKYERAAQLWRAVGNNRNAIQSLRSSAEIHFLLSEYQSALQQYSDAAKLAGASREKLLQASCWSGIGWVYSYTGDNRLARSYGTKALDLMEREANREPAAWDDYALALSNFSEVNYSMGNFVKASSDFQRAEQIFTELGDRQGQARAHLFAGYLAGSLGQPQKAEVEISTARELYRSVSNPAGEALCITAMGLIHSLKRDEDRAIKLHRQAIEMFRSVGDQHSEAIASMALGQAYEDTNEHPIALVNYEQALRLFRRHGSFESAAVALFQIAQTQRLSGHVDLAISFYEQSIRLSRSVRNSRTEVNALQELTALYAARGKRAETLEEFERVRRFYVRLGDHRGLAIALNSTGDFLFEHGDIRKALDLYRQALSFSETVGDTGTLILNLYNLARTYSEIGNLDTALSHVERSLKLIEAERRNLASADVRTSYFSEERKSYDLCIDILMRLERSRPGHGFAEAALVVSERARARSLVDLLSNSQADWRRTASEELINRERELRAMLRSQAQYQIDLLRSRAESSDLSEVAAQLDQLKAEYQELQSKVRDSVRDPSAFANMTAGDVKDIQAQLRDEDATLLEYALDEQRSYLWEVRQDSVQVYELPGRKTIEEAAMAFYKSLTMREEIPENSPENYAYKVAAADQQCVVDGQRLSQMLLGAVADRLTSNRIIVVSEGALQYVPFDTLPVPSSIANDTTTNGRSPLMIDAHEIVSLPSFSTLLAIRAQKSP